MTKTLPRALVAVGLVSLWPVMAAAQEKVPVPQPGVPELVTMEGRYVRISYNNEGFVTLGYRLANESVGQKWMLLEVGMTIRDNVPDYELTRAGLSLETPDGKTIALPSYSEYQDADTRALTMRERVIRDSINYFPPKANKACSIQFFPDPQGGLMPWDKVDLSDDRACLGRLFFPVPGGITYGQHFLNVQFAKTLVRVPFRILTKEEAKELDKHFKDIKKQFDQAFGQKS
jgi:hypothetical protein